MNGAKKRRTGADRAKRRRLDLVLNMKRPELRYLLQREAAEKQRGISSASPQNAARFDANGAETTPPTATPMSGRSKRKRDAKSSDDGQRAYSENEIWLDRFQDLCRYIRVHGTADVLGIAKNKLERRREREKKRNRRRRRKRQADDGDGRGTGADNIKMHDDENVGDVDESRDESADRTPAEGGEDIPLAGSQPLPVPPRPSDVSDAHTLMVLLPWIEEQRIRYGPESRPKQSNEATEGLSERKPVKIRLLEDVGFDFTSYHAPPGVRIEQLRIHVENRGGDCGTTVRYGSNPQLARFLQRAKMWRRDKSKTSKSSRLRGLTEEHSRILDELLAKKERHIFKSWDERLEDLRRYKEQYGSCSIHSANGGPHESLYRWVHQQKRLYEDILGGTAKEVAAASRHLTPERIERLEEAGLDLSVPIRTFVPWQERFEELRAYVAEHGSAFVPVSHPTLGTWVRKQREGCQRRRAGKPSFMTDERMKALSSLGFLWSAV